MLLETPGQQLAVVHSVTFLPRGCRNSSPARSRGSDRGSRAGTSRSEAVHETPGPAPEPGSQFPLRRLDQIVGILRAGQADVLVQPREVGLASLAAPVALPV